MVHAKILFSNAIRCYKNIEAIQCYYILNNQSVGLLLNHF